MLKPSISVLVPTRQRVDLLARMLDSLCRTAEKPERVDVVVRYDYDDADTHAFAASWQRDRHEAVAVQWIVGPRYSGYATLPKIINDASQRAHADLLIVINDDVEFKTHGWDIRLAEEAAKVPDGIFVLGVNTVMNNANWVFPCQSRTQIDALGCFFDDRLVYPDIWLRDVVQPLGRLIRVDDVVIEHQWVGMTDDQRRAAGRVHQSGYGDLYDRCVAEGQQKLRAVLSGVPA